MIILRCARCRQDIGQFDPDAIKNPLNSEMFYPKAKNYPPPFSPGQEWPHLYCKVCGQTAIMDLDNPRVQPDWVMTPQGKYDFVNGGFQEEKIKCPWCGREDFKTNGGLAGHKRFCKQKPEGAG